MSTEPPARPRSPDTLEPLRLAAKAPEQTQPDAHRLKLSPSDQAFVTALLDQPAPPSPALERADRRHAELIRPTPPGDLD